MNFVVKIIKYCIIIITSVTENGPFNPALTFCEKRPHYITRLKNLCPKVIHIQITAWVIEKPAHSKVYMMTLLKNKVTLYVGTHTKLDIYFLN